MKYHLMIVAGLLASGAWAAPPEEIGKREQQFDASISAADQMAWMKAMTSAPNHVGSAHNRANADFILAQFRAWGWDAKIETFDVLYPTPIRTLVELVSPEPVRLGGQEPVVAGAEAGSMEGALPPYVAFAADGDVTGDVVYVNYGLPADYEALARRGISVKGKIVLARYGKGWRGLKPKLAQEQGAIGCLIYSDPAQDGYGVDEPWPNGGARPETAVQRGSVADMTLYPGDPLTPGYGAVKGAKRLDYRQAPTIMKIPTLPISYGDAKRISAVIGGPLAPDSMRGGLPLTYRLGGADALKLRLLVESEWTLKQANNVIATMGGRERPDEWVVRGNHFDAWVFGAADPMSGLVAMLSEAKALGAMAKTGWRPARTIVYAGWDAEEPMLWSPQS